MPVNFKISFPSLPCEFADLDVSNVLGTHSINDDGVSTMGMKTIRKFPINSQLQELGSQYRDLPHAEHDEDDVAYKVQKVLQEQGKELDDHSIDITPQTFQTEIAKAPVVLVAFMAPWCHWCQLLHPVWEHTAGVLKRKYGLEHVHLASVNCVAYAFLCQSQHIQGYPTVRVFRHGSDYDPRSHGHARYTGDRTTEAIMKFVEGLLPTEVRSKYEDKPYTVLREESAYSESFVETKAVGETGCALEGFIMVKKVPGSFMIGAESRSHSFDHSFMNVSHIIHDLSFGHELTKADEYELEKLLHGPDGQSWHSFARAAHFASTPYVAQHNNVTFEHYMDVVLTTVETDDFSIDVYEYTAHSHSFQSDQRPHARFHFDPSPMQVVVTEENPSVAHFFTNLCAIIGGVFTVAGILDSIVHNTQRLLFKQD